GGSVSVAGAPTGAAPSCATATGSPAAAISARHSAAWAEAEASPSGSPVVDPAFEPALPVDDPLRSIASLHPPAAPAGACGQGPRQISSAGLVEPGAPDRPGYRGSFPCARVCPLLSTTRSSPRTNSARSPAPATNTNPSTS